MKLVFLLPLFLLFAACQNDVPYSTPSTEEVHTGQVTIQLVAFGTETPIPNYTVEITSTENELSYSEATDSAGQITVTNLRLDSQITVNLENDLSVQAYEVPISESNSTVKLHWYPRDIQAMPVVLQNPALPHGCEVTSLTAVLNYFGDPITKEELADQYMPKQSLKSTSQGLVGPDPYLVYAGNPRDRTGRYIFANGLINTLKAYQEATGASYKIDNVSGKSYKYLKYYIDSGIPIVIWPTIDYGPPRFNGGWQVENSSEYHQALVNVHAVVLTQLNEQTVTIMDPLKGMVEMDTNTFLNAYRHLGSQAIAVYK